MPTSQNGYPCNDRAFIATVTVPGTNVRLPVRKGVCGDLLVWAAVRWHREVEPLVEGTCWGYAERLIRGSDSEVSNHASGTAIDLNAPKHPLDTNPAANFTAAQITAIYRIVADAAPALRWGGSYGDPAHGGVAGSRPDGMHFELVAPEPVVAQVLTRVQGGGDDMSVWDRKETAWAGGVTDDKNTPYDLMMFVKRNNVIAQQSFLLMQRMAANLEADRQDILNALASVQTELAALKAKLT